MHVGYEHRASCADLQIRAAGQDGCDAGRQCLQILLSCAALRHSHLREKPELAEADMRLEDEVPTGAPGIWSELQEGWCWRLT